MDISIHRIAPFEIPARFELSHQGYRRSYNTVTLVKF